MPRAGIALVVRDVALNLRKGAGSMKTFKGLNKHCFFFSYLVMLDFCCASMLGVVEANAVDAAKSDAARIAVVEPNR